MTWRIDDPQGNEAAKIRWELVEYTGGKGLDLGCGQFKAFPHFIGVDNAHHWGMKGVDVHVDTCEDLSLFASQSMDFVFSSHLIEHIQDTKKALKEWWRVIKPSGCLILYAPHKELYPNVGQEGANPDHKHDFMPEDIEEAMKNVGGWDIIGNETGAHDREYTFLQVYYNDFGPVSVEYVIIATGNGGEETKQIIIPINIDETPVNILIPESEDLLKAQNPIYTPYSTITSFEILIEDIDIPVEVKADKPILVDINDQQTWTQIRRIV